MRRLKGMEMIHGTFLALTFSSSRCELALLIQSHLSLKATFFSCGGASSGSCKPLVTVEELSGELTCLWD